MQDKVYEGKDVNTEFSSVAQPAKDKALHCHPIILAVIFLEIKENTFFFKGFFYIVTSRYFHNLVFSLTSIILLIAALIGDGTIGLIIM